jgi:hypothetical protein
MNGLVSKDFRLVLLPLKFMPREHADYYRQTLACWEKVWREVNMNFAIESPLFIDGFLRQDEAACIFSPEGCVGMILFRVLDFAIIDFKADSYFKEWSDLDLAKLVKHGSRAFLSNYLSVDPKFRAFSDKVKFKEVFLDVMILRFLESKADVISGITRRDRAINDVSLGLGATMIRENVPYFEGRERVDLVAFYRAKAHRSQNPYVKSMTDELWQNRLDLTRPEAASGLKAA